MAEIVALPDPEVQPLVHPLDVPEARRLLRGSRVVVALTSPPTALLPAALIGYAGRSLIIPAVVLAVLVVVGMLAGRRLADRAWDYIPRSRQDRDRPLPHRWEVASAAVPAVLLGVALVVIVLRLGHDDVSLDVRSFSYGMCAIVTLLVAADAVIGLLRRAGRRRAVAALPGVVVIIAVTLVAYPAWFDGNANRSLLILGAVLMAAIAAFALAGRRWGAARRPGC
ncbi:hypothetical protein [Actinoplanes sp. N902-109]|uniref:hypothetical protein n=1 Tax=Actinoplanes sp. (strain N902-109) TaxID=649831 RepID=UPI0012FB6B80|nr:hypothetical protein [Actinoplanes sp. N902-109]